MCGLLTQIFDLLFADVKNKPFDWIDSGARALQTIVNCSIEPSVQAFLAEKPFETIVESVFKTLKKKYFTLPIQPETNENYIL